MRMLLRDAAGGGGGEGTQLVQMRDEAQCLHTVKISTSTWHALFTDLFIYFIIIIFFGTLFPRASSHLHLIIERCEILKNTLPMYLSITCLLQNTENWWTEGSVAGEWISQEKSKQRWLKYPKTLEPICPIMHQCLYAGRGPCQLHLIREIII